MWKSWDKVTQTEREKISELAEKFNEYKREIANMFQSGMSFAEIEAALIDKKLKLNF